MYAEDSGSYVPMTEQDYLEGYAYKRRCWNCGKTFYSFYPSRRYCSYRCRDEAYVERRRKRREASREKVCLYCGEPFKAKRRDAKYCSDSCRVLAYRKRKKKFRIGP